MIFVKAILLSLEYDRKIMIQLKNNNSFDVCYHLKLA